MVVNLVANVILDSKYRLVRELGHGGMGSVWEAHNLALDVDVAIKLLRSDLPQRELADRLLREARAVARLGHPNIVRVFDIGHMEDGRPFLVMELLRGRSFGQAISGPERMDPVLAVRSLLPVAHALAAAHEAGFVHRDLKPENIFLADQQGAPPRPILLDFGVALSWQDLSHRLTQEGMTIGTPAFMPPEQAQGEDVTFRGDIWSFSVLLYEAVTGQLPFVASNFPRLQREIIEQPAPPFSTHGVSEEELWSIVDKGLRKLPQERWHNMRQLGQALAKWLLRRGVDVDVSNGSLRAIWLSSPTEASGKASSNSDGTKPAAPGSMRDTAKIAWFSRQPAWKLILIGVAVAALGAALIFLLWPSARAPIGDGPPQAPLTSVRRHVEIVPLPAPPTPSQAKPPSTELDFSTAAALQPRGQAEKGEVVHRRSASSGAKATRRVRTAPDASIPSPEAVTSPGASTAIPDDIKTDF